MASYHQNFDAPVEDDYNALSEHGFVEDENYLDEIREPARAVHVGPLGGITRMYSQYWQSRGSASASELGWGLGFLAIMTLVLFGSGIYLQSIADNPETSGLMRTLYMLSISVNTIWVIVNIVPAISLIRRFLNKHAS